MKIVCDSCGAKYSIADEKVRGKVFKIRCKKCSEVIVVRGDSGGEDTGAPRSESSPAPAAAGGGSFAEAIWHLVVNGEQQGPFSPDQIGQMLSAGQIDWEAYAWRDGLDGWLHMREIDELVSAITGQPAPSAPAAAAPAREEPQGMFAAASAAAAKPAGGELFGGGGGGGFTAPEPAPAAARTGAAAGRGRGGDLFAAASTEPGAFASGGSGDEEDVVASKHDGGGGGTLTGARNENSVLFSLSNLQALATKGAPAATSGFSGGGATPAPPTRSGFASGSGSGLIDIRALSDGMAPAPGGAPSAGNIDDLLSIGGPSAFAPTLGAPVLMPAARSEGGKLLYVLLGVAALLVLGIIGLVVVILTQTTPPVAAVIPPPVVQPAVPGMPAAPLPGTSALPAPPTNEQPAPTGDEQPPPGSEGPARPRGPVGPGHGGTTKSGAFPGGGSTPTKAPEPTKRPDSRTADLDSLIGSALSGTKAPARPANEPAAAPRPSNLPAQPSRGDVGSAMAAVTGAVRGCAGGQTGTASIRIVFASSGRVTTSSVTSPPFAGTTAGSCMARAVRSARVPPFSNSNLTVTFPFVVR